MKYNQQNELWKCTTVVCGVVYWMDVNSRLKRLTNRQRAEKERAHKWDEKRNSTNLMDGSTVQLLMLDKEIRHVIYGYDENNNDNTSTNK